MKRFFVTVMIVASLALAFEVARDAFFFLTPNSETADYKIILVEPGPFAKTSEMLYREGLIKDSRRFMLISRLLRLSSSVKVGEYEVRVNMSPFQLLQVLTSGKSVLHAVHIPEGYNIEQIADELASKNLVDREEFIKLARDPRMAKLLGVSDVSLEGYLFPETYSFTHFTGDRVILRTMVEKFREVYNREIKFAAEKQRYTMHEVVTLASMIEKETGAPEERPIISSVFHNRMKIGMKLQSDPTVIYGKKGDKKNITHQDLVTPTPYNTYTVKGLPLGPISNPGKETLLAAVEPANTKYLYFVSRNDGNHVFTTNYEDHRSAVGKFQLDPRAREGHSWRDRLKKDAAPTASLPAGDAIKPSGNSKPKP